MQCDTTTAPTRVTAPPRSDDGRAVNLATYGAVPTWNGVGVSTSTARSDGELAGRRLLVTGASSGIGRATAEQAAAAGARVALLARRRDQLEELAASLPGGVDAHPVAAVDVRDEAAARTAVAAVADAMGGLDGLVNAAGVVRPEPLVGADPDGWRAMLEINVLGLLIVTDAAIPHLVAAAEQEDGVADLVNVSSMSGRRRPNPQMSAYAATKHAVHVLSDGYREELGPLGVRTSVISPGYVVTPIFSTDEHRTEHSEDFDRRMRDRGMPVGQVARAIVTALATRPGTMLFEIAMMSTAQ